MLDASSIPRLACLLHADGCKLMARDFSGGVGGRPPPSGGYGVQRLPVPQGKYVAENIPYLTILIPPIAAIKSQDIYGAHAHSKFQNSERPRHTQDSDAVPRMAPGI